MTADRFIQVQGVRTHYLEAGDRKAPHVVLLHGGEFGASAELAWERTIGPLAERFHVLAPDMLGYGHTDKVVEFGLAPERRHSRRLAHVAAFLIALGIHRAHFVGSSFGGAMLMHDAVSYHPVLPMRTLVSIAGSPPTEPDARAALQGFDGSPESMRALLQMLFQDPKWLSDDYVQRRLASAMIPGAYEAAASVRLPSLGPPKPPPSGEDTTEYEKVRIPTLLVVGAHEKCAPRWGPGAARRLPKGRLVVMPNSAHCAHLEEPEAFNATLVEFLDAVG